MAKARDTGTLYRCVATGCGEKYDPMKTRAGLRGFCSQACQDALAHELGWRRTKAGRPSQWAVVADELRRRRAMVQGAEPVATPESFSQRDEAEAQALARVRAEHVAQAFENVALVNHYMVQVAPGYTRDDLDAAAQILMAQQNELGTTGTGNASARKRLDLALDLIEQAWPLPAWSEREGPPPFAGVEPYYERLFQQIVDRHHPQGTGGDMSCLIAMVDWLWHRLPEAHDSAPKTEVR